MEVHVMVFEHRHGRDVTTYASEALAVAEAAGIARRWWGEARERDRSLPVQPPESDAEAVELYFAAQDPPESCAIAGCEVKGFEPEAAGDSRGTDPYIVRCAVERLVCEDRVPAEVLEHLHAEFGDRESDSVSGPARARGMDGGEAIEALFHEAHDSELAMLDELVERAGLGWKCRSQVTGLPCNHMNVGTSRCGAYGAADRRKGAPRWMSSG